MLEELKVEDIDKYTDLMTHEGNIGLFFHLPGHCAGCKRALGILEKKDLSNWKILLVNADIDDFKTLVHQFECYHLFLALSTYINTPANSPINKAPTILIHQTKTVSVGM